MPFATHWLLLALATTAAQLSGTVVDHEGRPVERATVWLASNANDGRVVVDELALDETNTNGVYIIGVPGKAEELARVETNADGVFVMDVPARQDVSRSWTLWAHARGARMASLELDLRRDDDETPVKLTLGPPSKVPVRVLGSDEKPVAGAKVRPFSLGCPDSLQDTIEATTNDQGLAVLEDVVPEQIIHLAVTEPGQVAQRHEVPAAAAEKTVHLLPVARIAVRLVSEETKALVGWTVIASTAPSAREAPFWHTSSVRGVSDESGRVVFPPLAAGLAAFRVDPPDGLPLLAELHEQVTVSAGDRVEVKIAVKKAVRAVGMVREHGTGKPAPGVKVELDPLNLHARTVKAIAGADGRFTVLLLPGSYQTGFDRAEMPESYYLPSVLIRSPDDVARGDAMCTIAPLEVWPATVIQGVVVDEDGKPVAGADVVGSGTSRTYSKESVSGYARTDKRGEFRIGHIPLDSTVNLRCRIGNRADSSPVVVRVNAEGVQDSLATLVLGRAKPTIALRGRMLGTDGKPVSGGRVHISLRKNGDHNPTGGYEGRPIVTRPDGTFQAPDGVPVADEYRVSARAPGMEPGQGDWAKAIDGALPDLVLLPVLRLREVRGRVVDTEGRAVAGAEVFQSGDGPRRTSNKTDADGRFAVPGDFAAPGFLFVSKDGYRFQGRRIGAGDEPVEIVVSKRDGPAPAPLKTALLPLSRAEERAKARALIAPLWEDFQPGRPEPPGPFPKAPTLALADPDRLVAMIENQVLRPDAALLAAVGLGLFEENPREAVAALDAIQPPLSAAEALLDLFDKVPDAPVGVRRELLERTEARVHEARERAQCVGSMARVADRWFEAGEPGKARRLLDEARADFKELSGSSPDDRGELAEALARLDLGAALALLQEGDDPTRLAGIARRAAASDPDGAIRVLKTIGQDSDRMAVLADVCAGMATRDLPKALALAGEEAPEVAALAVAAAARSKTATDPAAAHALLSEAFNRLERIPEGKTIPPAVAMARLLPLAVEVDPGRSSEYLWRAIAARPPRISDNDHWTVGYMTRDYFLVLAQLAALVAPYDRETAERVFAPVARYGRELMDEPFALGPEAGAILQAAALYDPRAALALLDPVSDGPPRPPGARPGLQPPRRQVSARLAIARALALPNAARRREVLHLPNQPDLWPALLDDRPAVTTGGRRRP